MATTITLGRPGSGAVRRFFRNIRLRPQLGDAWSDEAAAAAAMTAKDPVGEAAATFMKSTIGWGVVAFAVWTAGLRAAEAWRKG